jgi:hypothetical protein
MDDTVMPVGICDVHPNYVIMAQPKFRSRDVTWWMSWIPRFSIEVYPNLSSAATRQFLGSVANWQLHPDVEALNTFTHNGICDREVEETQVDLLYLKLID